jgi:hypothetical protein
MATLDKGVTLRPASTSLLTIDSEDRYASYNDARDNLRNISPYNFTLANGKVLLAGFFTRMAIQQVVFPWTIPNINQKTRDIRFVYNNGAGEVTRQVLVPTGFYTPTQLATAIQGLVRAIGVADAIADLATFTMTYGAVNNLPVFEYTVTSATLTVGFAPMASNSTLYPYPPTTKQLFDLLGFNLGDLVLAVQNSGTVTYAQAIRYIDIVSPDLVQCASLHDGSSLSISRDSLCRLYLADIDSTNVKGLLPSNALYAPAGTLPGTINYLPPIAKQIAWRANQNIGSSVRFQVYDDNGDLLDIAVNLGGLPLSSVLTDGSNWSMSLLVTEN